MLWTHVAAGVLGLAIGFGSAWQTQDWRYGAKEAKRLAAIEATADKDDKGTKVAATGLESDKAKIEIRYRTITKTVTKFIDRPIYQNTCLDQDGIDAINGVQK